MMQITATALPDVLLIETGVFRDRRGYFLEGFRQDAVEAALGLPVQFVQDNHARSSRGVLRGLHYQRPPHAQGKLVRVTRGRVFDVAVDVRRSSPTFRQWVGTELSDENHRQLWIPPGFAHGFLVLSDSADVFYKVTDYYTPAQDVAIRWDDPAIGVTWPLSGQAPILSERDQMAPLLESVSFTNLC